MQSLNTCKKHIKYKDMKTKKSNTSKHGTDNRHKKR